MATLNSDKLEQFHACFREIVAQGRAAFAAAKDARQRKDAVNAAQKKVIALVADCGGCPNCFSISCTCTYVVIEASRLTQQIECPCCHEYVAYVKMESHQAGAPCQARTNAIKLEKLGFEKLSHRPSKIDRWRCVQSATHYERGFSGKKSEVKNRWWILTKTESLAIASVALDVALESGKEFDLMAAIMP